MSRRITQMSASVRQRLLTLSRDESRDFQEVMSRFAMERLLYRLGHTQYRNEFILKGALLFVLWSKEIHRYTQDIDFLGSGEPTPERMNAIFKAVCVVDVDDDGLIFDADSVSSYCCRQPLRFLSERNLTSVGHRAVHGRREPDWLIQSCLRPQRRIVQTLSDGAMWCVPQSDVDKGNM